MNENKPKFRFLYVLLLILAIVFVIVVWTNHGNPGQLLTNPEHEVIELATGKYKPNPDQPEKTQKMVKLYYSDGKAYILLEGSDEKAFPKFADYYFTYSTADGILERITAKLKDSPDVQVYQIPAGVNVWNIVYPLLYLGFGVFIIYMIFKLISGSNKGAMSFGKSRAKAYTSSKIRFSDVAGTEEEKEELAEIVEFLKNPQKFTQLGARIPKGVLLVGRPGTGKTLLAKAVAGEANVPFISISGSDFVEMFVGVGASRVRDLFDQAKKNKPCIVFIDEIDAVGRQRGAGLGGGNDEREQTLNQLLVEMDGFESNEGIIVLAATNRSDVLDPALMRPGRFDRQIYVNAPDVKGREAILKVHARNKPIDESVDFSTLAKITVGFTGADIENMLNEAAILAARANRPKIIMSDITEGINKVTMGPQKKSRLITEKDKKLTAYHEAGHAILGKLLANCDEVQEVSIIPRGHAGGYTMTRPENDNSYYSYNFLMDDIAMTMGGRIAEELIFKDVTSGASSDISQATKIAHAMVYDYGMSKRLGFISLGSDQQLFIGRDYQQKRDFSEKLASAADDEMREILEFNYKRAKKLLSDNLALLHEMAALLLEKETIYKEEIDMLMSGKKADEIAKFMTERDKKQKAKEEKIKAEQARQAKLVSYENKVREGQKLLAEGIISESEYKAITDAYAAFVASLEEEKSKEAKEKPEEAKAEKTEKTQTQKTQTKTQSRTRRVAKPLDEEKNKKEEK